MSVSLDGLHRYLTKVSSITSSPDRKINNVSDQTDNQDGTTKALSEKLNLEQDSTKTPFELNPRWEENRRLYRFRLKTLFRVYYSKWFYVGLNWNERELLLLLVKRLKLKEIENGLFLTIDEPIKEVSTIRVVQTGGWNDNKKEEIPTYKVVTPAVKAIHLVGQHVLSSLSEKYDSLYNPTSSFDYLGLDLKLLYSPQDFTAIWKLRSFQTFRDILFVPFQARSLGKKGIRKNRIRGYRDGKGSSGDPKRTRMARQIDVLFWSEKYEDKVKTFFDDLDVLSKT